jgi:hypothetical protein
VRSAADNAPAEAFFSTLEHEVLSRHHFTTKAHARRVVVAWCQDLYNTRTQTQLSGIDVADPIRETRCRPTGRSLREAFTIPGEAQRSPKERHPQTTPRRPSLARHARRRNPHHPNAFRSSGKCLLTNREAPQSLALDAARDVYVVDFAGGSHTVPGRVVKLAAGSNTQTVLPFTGLRLPAGCGGGHRRQRLRHRPGHPTRGGVAGGMMSLPTMGA